MDRVFIGGTGSSGTTILKKILTQHPKISGIPVEFRLHLVNGGLLDLADSLSTHWTGTKGSAALHQFRGLSDYFSTRGRATTLASRKLISKSKWNEGNILGRSFLWHTLRKLGYLSFHPQTRLDKYFGEHYFVARNRLEKELKKCSLGVDQPDIPRGSIMQEECFHETNPFGESEAYKKVGSFMDSMYSKIGSSIYCNDTPLNDLHKYRIEKMFGDGKIRFIHSLRHPVDVVLSLARREDEWSPKNIEQAMQLMLSTVDMYEKNFDNHNKVLYMKLENLASETENVIKNIVDFLGISFSSRMMNEKVLAHRIERSRKNVSKQKVNEIWKETKNFYEKFGYEKCKK